MVDKRVRIIRVVGIVGVWIEDWIHNKREGGYDKAYPCRLCPT